MFVQVQDKTDIWTSELKEIDNFVSSIVSIQSDCRLVGLTNSRSIDQTRVDSTRQLSTTTSIGIVLHLITIKQLD